VVKKRRNIIEVHYDFFQFYEYEIDKVQIFYVSQLRYYSHLLQSVQLKFYTKFTEVHRSLAERTKEINMISTTAKAIAGDLNLLKSFVEVNRTAARKILKKHDKVTHVATKEGILERLSKERSFFLAEDLRHLIHTAEAFQSEVTKFIVRHF